jgi:hypothetical protein
MHFRYLILLAAVFFISAKSAKKIPVKGTVYYTGIYKGGANPPQEVLDRCCTEHPYTNKTVFLKRNYFSPAIYTISTDSAGQFRKCIKPGTYGIYINNEEDPARSKAIAAGKINADSLWITEPYQKIVVDKNLKDLKIYIKERRNNEMPPP